MTLMATDEAHVERQVQNPDRINSDRLFRVGSTRINLDRPGSTKTFTESKKKDTFTHLWFHSHENKAILAILRRFVGPPFYFQVSDPRGASYETPVQPQVALVVCKVTGPNTISASR